MKTWERKNKGPRGEDKGTVGQGKGEVRSGVEVNNSAVLECSYSRHPAVLDLDNPDTSLSHMNLREFKKISTTA